MDDTGSVRSALVIIVGAGPVGLVAALLLAGQGVASTVLERHPEPYGLPRAVHLDDEAVRVLQQVGVAEAFAGSSRPMPGMRLLDARRRVLAEFSRADPVGRNGHPPASMVHQPDLDAILSDAVARCPLVTLRRGCEVQRLFGEGPVHVQFREDGVDRTMSAAAVLACDGANSAVRKALGIGLHELQRSERWLVVDARVRRPLGEWGGVHQVCDPARAATFMSVVEDRYRWEFRLLAGETEADLVAALPRLLAPWVPFGDVEVVRAAEYTFRAAVADRWRVGRVFLLGDAAHQTPPFVGQGLGAGLRDAANLAWKLAAVLHGADEQLLATYEQERRPHVTTTIRAAALVGVALTGGRGRAALARRALLGALGHIPGAPRRLATLTSPRLGRSALARRTSPWDPTGTTCPQPLVERAGTTVPFDDLLGAGWALVTTRPAVVAGARTVDLRAVRVVAGTDLARWLRRHGTHSVLVRPDRIVAAAGRRASRAGDLLGGTVARCDTTWP